MSNDAVGKERVPSDGAIRIPMINNDPNNPDAETHGVVLFADELNEVDPEDVLDALVQELVPLTYFRDNAVSESDACISY